MILLLLFTFSCKPHNPEEKKLDALESNLKYKSYKTLSENTLPPVVLLYNSTNPAVNPDISEGVMRLLLGYSWIVSNQPDFAIAESKIIDDLSTNDKDLKILDHSLAAMAMYDKGWKSLAADEAEKGSVLFMKLPNDTDTKLKAMTFHLIQGTLCVYQENYERARFHFLAFGNISKINWPCQLVEALADMKYNDVKSGLKKIKLISLNKTLPDTLRQPFKELIVKTDKDTGKIDSKIFWPRLVSFAMYAGIRNSAIDDIGKVCDLLAHLNKKLKIE